MSFSRVGCKVYVGFIASSLLQRPSELPVAALLISKMGTEIALFRALAVVRFEQIDLLNHRVDLVGKVDTLRRPRLEHVDFQLH